MAPPSLSMKLASRILDIAPTVFTSQHESDLRLISIASTKSLLDAFEFIRSSPEEDQARLREKVWSWTFGAVDGKYGAGQQGVHPQSISQLIHLSLRPEEHEHLLRFLTRPPRSMSSAALSALHDLVTIRLLHQGKYAETIQLDRESAGLSGSEVERQRRREMVREFISILPAVQREALAVDGNFQAIRREEEREAQPNPMPNGDAMDEDVPRRSFIDKEADAMAVDVAVQPTPRKPSQTASASSTPSRPHSPFSGPPVFAPPQQASLRHRVLSGSPFALPRSVSGASALAAASPKPPRRIVNDDAEEESSSPQAQQQKAALSRTVSRTRQKGTPNLASQLDNTPAAKKAQTSVPRRSRRVVSGSNKNADSSASASAAAEPEPVTHAAERTPAHVEPSAAETTPAANEDPAAEPVPEPAPSPPSHRTRSRTPASVTSVSTLGPMPGAFREPAVEPVPEDEVVPFTPSRPTRTPARHRTTRSVSRALLDEDAEEEDHRPRKTRRSTREHSVASSVAESVESTTPMRSTRRSTRISRAGTAQPSERGSPTPSMASVGGQSESGRPKRRSARESSVSKTPRATRSKK